MRRLESRNAKVAKAQAKLPYKPFLKVNMAPKPFKNVLKSFENLSKMKDFKIFATILAPTSDFKGALAAQLLMPAAPNLHLSLM